MRRLLETAKTWLSVWQGEFFSLDPYVRCVCRLVYCPVLAQTVNDGRVDNFDRQNTEDTLIMNTGKLSRFDDLRCNSIIEGSCWAVAQNTKLLRNVSGLPGQLITSLEGFSLPKNKIVVVLEDIGASLQFNTVNGGRRFSTHMRLFIEFEGISLS